MDGENQEAQDILEQERRREFEQLRLQDIAQRQKLKAQAESSNSRIKKSKKKAKTILLIGRIIMTGGFDFKAWFELVKQHPFLALILAISLFLLVIFILLILIALVYFIIDNSLLGVALNPETFMGPDNAALKGGNIIKFGR